MNKPYSFYKGAARAALVYGIPRNVFLVTFGLLICLGLAIWKGLWFLAPVIYVFLFKVYRKDPDGLQLLMLSLQTTFIHALKDGKEQGYETEDFTEHKEHLK
ncbi:MULTISPECIES: VirB3 family type IV secretion system protein [Enterobacteriaceae]|uniref:VirB3 family type IV secretion system protein n=1 Tax=Enterobacteriaceae TaxID=543 RepID=UPI000CC807D9|nr:MULTISPECIES: VirB3 family type IV secretion system protein [Enterobacteriaceae]EAN4566651.1 hypothetical protein [Salmonella enterica subsp. enterica serovar Senftenberg]EAT0477564.1 hypothetical protein [Salmonella enterica]EBG8282968.1 hypothetical protein [Salmonella enterica subsp. enterica serovar Muenchen]EBX4631455.1 hypothetical protein [Salmonella enterica subsp. enterica serovar Infantis]ECE8411184.1 hypothetical protein [Salmonella enterica subsp. enterica serovar Anatum]ECU435